MFTCFKVSRRDAPPRRVEKLTVLQFTWAPHRNRDNEPTAHKIENKRNYRDGLLNIVSLPHCGITGNEKLHDRRCLCLMHALKFNVFVQQPVVSKILGCPQSSWRFSTGVTAFRDFDKWQNTNEFVLFELIRPLENISLSLRNTVPFSSIL